MRILLWVFAIFIALGFVLSMLRNALFGGAERPSDRSQNGGKAKAAAKLVKDPVCGTYVPEETSLRANGFSFCSDECRTRHLAGTSA